MIERVLDRTRDNEQSQLSSSIGSVAHTNRAENQHDFKVDFFCVGTAKAGTTSLHDLLDLQPEICLPNRKETNYFSFGVSGRPSFRGPLDQTSINEPTITSFDEYREDFDQTSGCLFGEVCPSYALPGVARRLHEHNPNAKIIILLRDPVSRTYSNYQHLVRDGREPLSFEEALAAEEHRLVEGWEWFWALKRNSLYADLVKEYFDVFAPENVHVLFFEDFVRDQKLHLHSVMNFLGLDATSVRYEGRKSNTSGVVSRRWKIVHRVILAEGPVNTFLRALLPPTVRKRLGEVFKFCTTESGELSMSTRASLYREFEGDLEQLRDLLGSRVEDWRDARDVP